MHRKLVVLIVVALIAVPVVGSVQAVGATPPGQVAKEPPEFEIIVPEPQLRQGATQQLTFQVLNDADDPNTRVKNATNVRVEFLGVKTIEPVSGPRLVGVLQEGRPATVTTAVEVSDNAATGVYDVPVEITYEYRTDSGVKRETKVVDATVEVVEVEEPDRAEFEVKKVTADARVGDQGTVSVRVKNTGDAVAEDAAVTLQTTSSSVAFGKSSSATRFVGEFETGETHTLTYDVTVAEGAENRSYTLQGTVNYEDEDGRPQQSAPLRFGFTPDAEQGFAVRKVRTTLEVGERGTIGGTIENTGSEPVENAVVVLQGSSPMVQPLEPEHAVGTLEPGETARFRMDALVKPDASAGPRQLTFRVRHRSSDGSPRASDPLDARIQVAPEQTFDVDNVSADLQVGNQGTIEGTVVNTGDRAIENAVVLLQGSSPTLTPVEPEYAVGRLKPGQSKTFQLEALPSPDASPGPRQLTLRVQYNGEDGSPRASDPKDVQVQVTPEQSFDVRNVESTLRVSEEGTIEGQVVNTGDRAVDDVVVNFQTSSPMITPLEPEYAVGRLEAGESATFSLEAQVRPNAGAGPRQMNFRVQYKNDDGDRRASDPLSAQVQVGVGQSFALEGVQSDLRVGNEGTVRGQIVNTGNRTLNNLVVAFQANSPSLTPTEPEYAVGTLEPGESAPVSFDVEVTDSAKAGPRQVTLRARYNSEEGEPRASDPLDAQVSVGPRQDTFDVEVVDARVEVGSSGKLNLTITNNDTEVLTDVSGKLYPTSPVSASDDQAFIDRLEPGESKTVTYEVGMGSGAIVNKTYPLEMDFRFTDSDGDTRITDTYQLPVESAPASDSGGGGILLPLVIVVVVVAAIGAFVYFRR